MKTEEKLSVCCSAPMLPENNQCLTCGADGSHFVTDEEQQKLFDAEVERLKKQ